MLLDGVAVADAVPPIAHFTLQPGLHANRAVKHQAGVALCGVPRPLYPAEHLAAPREMVVLAIVWGATPGKGGGKAPQLQREQLVVFTPPLLFIVKDVGELCSVECTKQRRQRILRQEFELIQPSKRRVCRKPCTTIGRVGAAAAAAAAAMAVASIAGRPTAIASDATIIATATAAAASRSTRAVALVLLADLSQQCSNAAGKVPVCHNPVPYLIRRLAKSFRVEHLHLSRNLFRPKVGDELHKPGP